MVQSPNRRNTRRVPNLGGYDIQKIQYRDWETERRLLIEITYNLEKNQKEYFKNLQLNLFDNENHR